MRARLVRRAERWRWGSLWRRARAQGLELLADGPIPRPADWRAIVNRAEPRAELERLRIATKRGRPFGADPWLEQVVRRFGLGSTLRPRGRPRQKNDPLARRGEAPGADPSG